MTDNHAVVSEMDKEHLTLIRENVIRFLKRAAVEYRVPGGGRLLDIAPQDYEGARPFFGGTMAVDTLDINPQSGCTYIGEVCRLNKQIADGSYDVVVCTEVLEHTLQPFDAVQEIWRILRPGGILAISVPFNFRIHGPLPDCWRFTVHGLRELLAAFEVLEISALETPGRDLMPIHYTVVARRPLRDSVEHAGDARSA